MISAATVQDIHGHGGNGATTRNEYPYTWTPLIGQGRRRYVFDERFQTTTSKAGFISGNALANYCCWAAHSRISDSSPLRQPNLISSM
jgi:hypothetical protein